MQRARRPVRTLRAVTQSALRSSTRADRAWSCHGLGDPCRRPWSTSPSVRSQSRTGEAPQQGRVVSTSSSVDDLDNAEWPRVTLDEDVVLEACRLALRTRRQLGPTWPELQFVRSAAVAVTEVGSSHRRRGRRYRTRRLPACRQADLRPARPRTLGAVSLALDRSPVDLATHLACERPSALPRAIDSGSSRRWPPLPQDPARARRGERPLRRASPQQLRSRVGVSEPVCARGRLSTALADSDRPSHLSRNECSRMTRTSTRHPLD